MVFWKIFYELSYVIDIIDVIYRIAPISTLLILRITTSVRWELEDPIPGTYRLITFLAY